MVCGTTISGAIMQQRRGLEFLQEFPQNKSRDHARDIIGPRVRTYHAYEKEWFTPIHYHAC